MSLPNSSIHIHHILTPTIQSFNDNIEANTDANYKRRNVTPSVRGYGITRGKEFEKLAAKLLASHPNVANVETEVMDATIDEFSCIDVVVTTKDNRRVYIPCAYDLWKGTAQIDRLECVYLKAKHKWTEQQEVCYLIVSDVLDYIMSYKGKARKELKIRQTLAYLLEHDRLKNIDSLWEYLN